MSNRERDLPTFAVLIVLLILSTLAAISRLEMHEQLDRIEEKLDR